MGKFQNPLYIIGVSSIPKQETPMVLYLMMECGPAIPWAGNTKGFCIIHNGKQVHSVKTYKQALAYIKKESKIKKKSTSTLEEFL